MAKVTIYRNKRDGVLHLRFNHAGSHASRSLPFKVEESQWRDGKVVNHPRKDSINLSITSTLAAAQTEVLRVVNTMPTRTMTPQELRDIVCEVVFNDVKAVVPGGFFETFSAFIRTHDNEGTRAVYTTTYNILQDYDPNATFDSVDVAWLNSFHLWMNRRRFSANYRNIQERNIRAVFNYAIDNGITTAYPFRRFKIGQEQVDSRDITPEEWRKVLAYANGAEDYKKMIVDLFILQLLLIGINLADLYALRPSDYTRGRIKYTRQKTGKKYSIKVHPMAATILDKYKGEKHLIQWFDEVSKEWALKAANKVLKEMAHELGISQRMSTYVSRYSWASIAYNELDISMEVISQALGHSFGLKVTSGYINVNEKKVDEANERVINYIFQLGV